MVTQKKVRTYGAISVICSVYWYSIREISHKSDFFSSPNRLLLFHARAHHVLSYHLI